MIFFLFNISSKSPPRFSDIPKKICHNPLGYKFIYAVNSFWCVLFGEMWKKLGKNGCLIWIGAIICSTIGRLLLFMSVCHTNGRSIKNRIGSVMHQIVGMGLKKHRGGCMRGSLSPIRTRPFTTMPIIFFIDRPLAWDTGMYMYDINGCYNWPIVAPIVTIDGLPLGMTHWNVYVWSESAL